VKRGEIESSIWLTQKGKAHFELFQNLWCFDAGGKGNSLDIGFQVHA
jgi:hypothetical protein